MIMKKYEELKKIFEDNRNIENAQQMSDYMRNQFNYYGINTASRRKLYKDLIKAERKNGTIDWHFLDACYADEHREMQYFVCDYLMAFEDKLLFEDINKIKKYVKMKQWWDTIDNFDGIIGNIGLIDKRVDDLMRLWSKDEDFWLRRIAIDHQLSRKEKTDTKLFEDIIINNFGSKEFFINKAIGWSLREYSKTNPKWVKNFIDSHRNELSKLSVSEGSKYI